MLFDEECFYSLRRWIYKGVAGISWTHSSNSRRTSAMRSLAVILLTAAFVAHFFLDKVLRVSAGCPAKCVMNYSPICAIRFGAELPNHCNFLNLCLLVLYICKTKEQWHILSTGLCDDYSPRCDDIVDYFRNNTELITFQGANTDEDDE